MFVFNIYLFFRDILGKSIISFCVSLAIAMAILAILKLMEYEDMTLCAVRGKVRFILLILVYCITLFVNHKKSINNNCYIT